MAEAIAINAMQTAKKTALFRHLTTRVALLRSDSIKHPLVHKP